MIRKVKDFRTDCKSACKRDCYAGGCPYAGAGCKTFDSLVDFSYLTKGATNGKKEKENADHKKGGTEKENAASEKGRRALQV